MRNLKLIEAAGISAECPDPSALNWEATREGISIFRASVSRTARMMEAPAYAAITADFHRLALHRICGGEPTAKRLGRIPHLGEKVEKIMGELINQDTETVRAGLEAMIRNLDNFIQRTTNVHSIFESFLNGILIQAWTSVEVLARQLLKNSILKHPECFILVAPEEARRLSTHTFQKLETIRSAYESAFANDERIMNLLNDQCVDALYFVRNLLSHSGGVVDGKFRKNCAAKHLTAWAALENGTEFPITGEIVRSLVDRNAKCGYSLLTSVDLWLTDHRRVTSPSSAEARP